MACFPHCYQNNIKSLKFSYPCTENKWKGSQFVNSLITSYYAKQENEWNKVKGIYFRLFNFRKMMKPLIYRYFISKSLKNIKNTEDPVTLEVPIKPVIIIDFKNRISFTYESNTLKRTIENRILY